MPLSASLPGKRWALVMDVQGFKVEVDRIQPDGRKYVRATNPGTGSLSRFDSNGLTAWLTARSAPEFLRKGVEENSRFKFEDIQQRPVGPLTTMEYLVSEWPGQPVQQKNVLACLTKEDVFVDVHLSKTPCKPGEEVLFQSLLSSIRFVERKSMESGSRSGTSQDYFNEGSKYYLQRNYVG